VKQLIQNYRTGVLCVEEAPVPALQPVEVNLAALDSQHD
jgi:hypothetical protein